MNLALFSDLHGRLRIAMHLMRCSQKARGVALDGALLPGDVGVFPITARMDRATVRWVERDPEEAGFSRHFCAEDQFVQDALDGPPGCDSLDRVPPLLLLTPGNHEDYAFLDKKGRHGNARHAPMGTFPVDFYEAVHVIRNGSVVSVKGQDGHVIRVASLWGIEQAKPGAPYAMNQEAASALVDLGRGAFDLLLTHDAPYGLFPGGKGASLVSDVLRTCQPAWHLFGHVHPHHGIYEYAIEGASTRCLLLNNLNFGPDGQDRLEAVMAILEWRDGSGEVHIVDEPWLRQMTRTTWQHVLPPS